MSENQSFKLAANRWVIKARWFYVLAIAVICLLARFGAAVSLAGHSFGALLTHPLALVLYLALLFNLLLYVISRMIGLEKSDWHVGWLSFLQVAGETALISLLFYDLPGGEAIMPILYFIPIVESILLFGHFGPLIVSILIGVVLNIIVFFSDLPFLSFILARGENQTDIPSSAIITWTLILSVVYLIIGVVSSYIARQIAVREKKLAQESTEQAVQLNALKNFNSELEREERSLEAKDYELKMANDRLAELESAKSKFVSVTAHQLRTPLSAIKWTFDMMLNGQLGTVTDEQKEFLKKGYDSTQRMIRIVGDLLQIDNIQAEKNEYHFAPLAVEDLVDSVRFEFENQAKSKDLDLEINKPLKRLPLIEGDENKLRIVLENLLDNAIKYSHKGGLISIVVSDKLINSAAGMVEISIADAGIGILEADKSKVFGKFFRAQNAIRQEPDGSGIGLYLSKDIIEKHGGSLSYESGPGEGTIFRLTLPVKQAKQ